MKLFYKVDNCEVEVYHFYEDKTVLIFSAVTATHQNGNGWVRCAMKNLLPIEYVNGKIFMSKSEKNKIKERLTLSQAIWTCTDGVSFSNCEEAIEHEKEIIKGERDA